MKKNGLLLLVIFILSATFLLPDEARAWETSYVYFQVIDSDGRVCRDVIVNTTTQQAKYYKRTPYTTERVGSCIQYKVMGCGKVKESRTCYHVNNSYSQTVTVQLR
jgi:hypothetical protein